jgi:hypothetical protein
MRLLATALALAGLVAASANAQESGRRRLVPASPPDTIPAWIVADSNLVGDSVQTAAYFYANVIRVRFRTGTSQADRQAAIDAVQGVVVGGRPYPAGEGAYYVRIEAGRRIEPLRAAATRLRGMRQVAVAVPVYKTGEKLLRT